MTRRWHWRFRTAPQPLFYGLLARLSDRQAGIKDGRAGLPAVTVGTADALDVGQGVTPYLEMHTRRYRDRAERARRHAVEDTVELRQSQQVLLADIAAGDARVADIRKMLDGVPATPDEAALTRRNALEQAAHDALVRDRRQREHEAARARLVTDEQHAVERVRALRVEEARVAQLIASREQILDCRVRQLHQHTLRRCATYMRLLVRKHPDGPAVIPLLDLGFPTLPEWLAAPQAQAVRT